jgi:5'-deoxynucleotidase YfbR-like HD superfamily hydrolase
MLNVQQILSLNDVRRWHTRRVQRDQSVAEHSATVALLALHLAPAGIPSEWKFSILHVALTHDAHEAVYGDMPYPAKRAMTERGMDVDGECRRAFWGDPSRDPWETCSPLVRQLVELADILEAALYAKKYLPELAPVIHSQAVKAIRESMAETGITFRALQALGEVQ